MNDGFATPLSAPPVLTSWKDIARYMGKGVRTVQRWEQDFGLPVRRPVGSNRKAILARPGDLDAWVAHRCASRSERSFDGHNPVGTSLPPGMRKPPASSEILSALHAQIYTSRMLRSSNQELIHEMRLGIHKLKQELTAACSGPRTPGD